jgi:hypothetical protein
MRYEVRRRKQEVEETIRAIRAPYEVEVKVERNT